MIQSPSQPDSGVSRLTAYFAPFGPWALGVVGLLMAFWTSIVSLGRQIPGDPGDVRLCEYFMEHSYLWLMRVPGHLSLWDPPFFFPHTNILAYSDSLLGVAPFYWVWRGLSFSPDHSLMLWLISITSLNYWVGYQWLRQHFELKREASALGAFLIAFGSVKIGQLNHPQLIPAFYVILAVQAAGAFFKDPGHPTSRSWIPIFAAGAALQVWTDFYLTWFLVMGLLVSLIWAMINHQRRQGLFSVLRIHWRPLVFWGLASCLAVLPALIHYGAAALEVGHKDFGMVKPWLPRPGSWFFMGRGSWLYFWQERLDPWRSMIEGGVSHEHALGIGWLTFVLACLGLRRKIKEPEIRLYVTIIAVAVAVTTLWIPHVAIWGVLYEILPGAAALRALSRIGLILLLPLSVGVALFFDAQSKRKPLLILLALICVLEQGHQGRTYDSVSLDQEVRKFAAEVSSRKCQYFYLNPLDTQKSDQPWRFQMDALWVEMKTGVPTLNGYSGNFPPGWDEALFDVGKLDVDSRQVQRRALLVWIKLKGLAPDGLCWLEPSV